MDNFDWNDEEFTEYYDQIVEIMDRIENDTPNSGALIEALSPININNISADELSSAEVELDEPAIQEGEGIVESNNEELNAEHGPDTEREEKEEVETQDEGNENDLYEQIDEENTRNRKYTTDSSTITLRLKEAPKQNPISYLKKVFEKIVKKYIDTSAENGDNENNRVGVSITNREYPKPIYVTYRRPTQVTTDVILGEVEKVVQSNENFFANIPLIVKITTVKMPHGQKRNRNQDLLPFHQFCSQRKYSILTIENDDNLCLPRAIVTGLAYLNKNVNDEGHKKWKRITDKRSPQQKLEAEKLCREAGVNESSIGNLESVNAFQRYLQEYTITVFDGSDRRGRKILYQGQTDSTKYIDLIYGDQHFNIITNLNGAFGYNYYCRQCNTGYNQKSEHTCKMACKRCLQTPACVQERNPGIKCSDCQIYFNSDKCYRNHKMNKIENKKTVCETIKYCQSCKKIYTLAGKGKQNHICGHHTCLNCKKYVPADHLCYIMKKKEKPAKKTRLYLFFDLETRIKEVDGRKVHVPNYCVIEHQCDKCIDDLDISVACTSCGIRQHIIDKEGDELMKEFFDILRAKSTREEVFIFAHNGGGYDYQFLLDYMITELKWTPSIIKNGSKIVTIKYKNAHFKDTLNFFNTKLANLPKMFDIPETCKGYFPHFFNKVENYNYVGPIPDAEYYGSEYMSAKDREKFTNWHKEQRDKNVIFNFKEEMKKYCVSDVEILRKASLKFRNLFLELLRVDPLAEAVTIASACMLGYRINYLPENTVGLMTFKSYRMRNNQSALALKYIRYLEEKYNVQFESAYRGVERKLGNHFVDAYHPSFPVAKLDHYDEPGTSHQQRPVIIEVQGCYFHGCKTCFSDERRNAKISNSTAPYETLEQRYENTRRKIEFLRNHPSHPYVIEKWECDIRRECLENETLKKFIMYEDVSEPIATNREAFFGGRTESFCRYYRVKEGEKIMYIDVNSLYPFVNKYGVYPKDHPRVLVGKDIPTALDGITGIVKLKILAPKRLYFPVLPQKINNKLIFALCKTCAQTENRNACTHSDEERAFVGTFTCVEICKAVEKGYKLLEIYELWEYESTQYDKNLKKGGLFAEYIDKFLKIKQKASGFPPHVVTTEQKEEFVRLFTEKESIPLAVDEVQPNPGLRALSKLCLNSLWGKFGQRNTLTQTSIIDNEGDYYRLFTDPSLEVTDITFANEDISVVSYRNIDEVSADTGFINPVVSAHVTAHARLYLYSFLEKLGDRVLYCDTDSIIYILRPGDDPIETGPYLGEMGDELEAYGDGSYIEEFVCEGPKNYSYRVRMPNGSVSDTTKVRGFTLNYQSSLRLNHEAMKEFVLSRNPENISITEPHKIQRKRLFKIVTQELTKQYKPVSSKRRKIANYETLPYGYVDTLDVELEENSDDEF